jgi:uncharacterized spore protein YtfJ
MNTKTVAILVVAAAAVGGVALLVDSRSRGVAGGGGEGASDARGDASAVGSVLLPTLASRVNDAALLRISQGETTLTMKRMPGDSAADASWVIDERGGYPAKFEAVRSAMIALSQFAIAERKTAMPERYADIGVQDPGQPVKADKQPPTLVTVQDAKGETLASLIVGDVKWGGGGGGQQYFVRRSGEAQSWLAGLGSGAASGARLELQPTIASWVNAEIVNIARDRIKLVSLRSASDTIMAVRDSEETQAFALRDIPKAADGTTRALRSQGTVDQLPTAASFLNLEDVAAASTLESAFTLESTTTAEFRTFDGLVLVIRVASKDGKDWAMLEASFDESVVPTAAPPVPPAEGATDVPAPTAETAKYDAARAEAETLRKRFSGWAYQIPEWKARTLRTTWSELLAEEAE